MLTSEKFEYQLGKGMRYELLKAFPFYFGYVDFDIEGLLQHEEWFLFSDLVLRTSVR